jgi:hypothetical protein
VKCPLGGRPQALAWQKWMPRAPCQAHGAHEYSLLMPTFLKTNTCSSQFHPLACALREEEPWSVHGCPRGEYATAVTGLYAQEGAPLRPVAPIKHPLDAMEDNKEKQGALDPLLCLTDHHIGRSDFSKKSSSYQSTSLLKASISISLAIWTT